MTTHAPLRWGLLSTARINRSIIPPIRSSRKSELVAIASRNPQKAAEYAATWGIPRYFASYEDLLRDPELDVIYISVPNSLHANWSIQAMQMGKHVLCEKPITTSVSDLDAVAETAQNTGKIISEAFMYRHHPQTLRVKGMIEQGEIGNLQLIKGSFCYRNTRKDDPRFESALGGGSLWDVGCYPISYACYITGKAPIEVYGHHVRGPTGIDVMFVGQLLFPGDVVCQFDCSFISEFKAEVELTGDRGWISILEPYKPGKRTSVYLRKDGRQKTIRIGGQELYLGEIRDMEDAILDGKPSRISLQDSKKVIRTVEALFESASMSKSVRIIN